MALHNILLAQLIYLITMIHNDLPANLQAVIKGFRYNLLTMLNKNIKIDIGIRECKMSYVFYKADMSCVLTKSSTFVIAFQLLALFVFKLMIVGLTAIAQSAYHSLRKSKSKYQTVNLRDEKIMGEEKNIKNLSSGQSPKNNSLETFSIKLTEFLNHLISKNLIIYFTVAAAIDITSNSLLSLKYYKFEDSSQKFNTLVAGLLILSYFIFMVRMIPSRTKKKGKNSEKKKKGEEKTENAQNPPHINSKTLSNKEKKKKSYMTINEFKSEAMSDFYMLLLVVTTTVLIGLFVFLVEINIIIVKLIIFMIALTFTMVRTV